MVSYDFASGDIEPTGEYEWQLLITGRRNGRPLLMRTPIAHFTVGTPI